MTKYWISSEKTVDIDDAVDGELDTAARCILDSHRTPGQRRYAHLHFFHNFVDLSGQVKARHQRRHCIRAVELGFVSEENTRAFCISRWRGLLDR